MSTVKVKRLHLLGILHSQDVHGYQLNQLLGHPTNAISIGKANAYKLLAGMEEEGFVSHVEERQGNRPPRLVYSITELGKEEFGRLLRESLPEFQPLEYANGVSLNFIGLLEPQEALALLTLRQERLAGRCATLNGVSDDILASHPGIDFLVLQAELENKFRASCHNLLSEERQAKIIDTVWSLEKLRDFGDFMKMFEVK